MDMVELRPETEAMDSLAKADMCILEKDRAASVVVVVAVVVSACMDFAAWECA